MYKKVQDRKYKLARKKLNNNTAAKTQASCVIAAKILYRFLQHYIISLIAVKRQMTPYILEEESTDNSLPVSLLFRNKKPSSLCTTNERP